MSYDHDNSAEQNFRDAFDRLKRGKPQRMPLGTFVSQNNVAKEAGKDPSALRKSRYPVLINDIQEWLEEHSKDAPLSRRQEALKHRKERIDLKARNAEIISQRDIALSLLVESDNQLLHLIQEKEQWKAGGNVKMLASRTHKK